MDISDGKTILIFLKGPKSARSTRRYPVVTNKIKTHIHTKIKAEEMGQGLRAVAALKEKPGFSSEYQHSGSQLSVTLAIRGSRTLF